MFNNLLKRMNLQNKMHIVIAGERSATKSFVFAKTTIVFLLCSSLIMAIFLSLTSIAGYKFFVENSTLKSSLAKVNNDLDAAESWNKNFEATLNKKMSDRENKRQQTLFELKAKSAENEVLLKEALTELQSRSKIVETILRTVGIKLKDKPSSRNSGGPYIPLSEDSLDDLAFRVDYYLDTMKSLPLGAPVWGNITSKYGRRIDPINNKPSFHGGVDIRKTYGAKIYATADGTVVEQGYNRGHGNYLLLDHLKGFKTRFFHMKEALVNKGEEIKRGQVVGLVGNSGRSTGTHLHYEIIYNDKTVNPLKFIRIARQINVEDM